LLEKARRLTLPTWIFLWSAAIVYTYRYLVDPALPGNNLTYPEGWWGWFDQSQYLLAAKSWLAGDFAPAHHYYPPLYPVIGALFYRWMPVHPFFFFNGAAFVTFIYVFMRFSTRYVTRVEAFLIVAIAVYFNGTIMENFAIPWSTAGTILIYSIVILMLSKLNVSVGEQRTRHAMLRAFAFAACFGLLVILRPVDAGVAAVFFPGYLWLQFKRDQFLPNGARLKRVILTGISLGLGLLVGIALFVIYNKHVFGNPLGGYIASTATSSGYFVSELPRKAYSILFDSNTFFVEPDASVVSKFPWIMLSIAGLIVFLIRGDALLRILALAIIFHFCLYAPYGDLLPNGIWRFKNIHYFKWTFPYLMLFAWLSIRWAAGVIRETPGERISLRQSGTRVAALVLICLAVSSLRFVAFETPVANKISVRGATDDIAVQVPDPSKAIDFIDFQGLGGGFTDVYFGQHHVLVDGKPLYLIRDFRLVPAPWGARLLFIHPVTGREVVFSPIDSVKIADSGLKTYVGSYRLSLGRPKRRHDIGCAMGVPLCSPS